MTSLDRDPSSHRRLSGRRWFIWLLTSVVVIVGYIGFGFFRNQRNYTAGHRAWQQADCATALDAHDRVINRSLLNPIRWFADQAELEHAQCRAFEYALESERSGNLSGALYGYTTFVTSKPTSPLNEAVRTRIRALFETASATQLAASTTCAKTAELLRNKLVPQPELTMPALYHACGQRYTADNSPYQAFAAYQTLLAEYPDHALAEEAEAALLTNPAACENLTELRTQLADRADFLPTLYLTCGEQFEEQDPAEAVALYERFLADFPDDPRAETARAGLARAMVAEARSAGANEILAPSSRGTAPRSSTIIEIQNDAPYRLQIVLSGPESLIAEIAACDRCSEVSSIMQSLACQARGPVGRYTLPPGEYDVVVRTLSGDAQPFTGTWTLNDSNEYYQCFFVANWPS
ncbi:MAG: hypothetical protein OHK0015_06050 [Chloroflexi bacterium OHK40]